jgi:hypothetical protein
VQLAGFASFAQLDEGASPRLQHWAWTDGGWVAGEGFNTQPGSLTNMDGVAAVIGANGNLSVLYSGLNLNIETGRLQSGYLASSRSLSVDLSTPTPAPTISATVTFSETTADSTPTPAPTIQPTPTVFFPQEPDGGGGFSIPFLGSLGAVGAIIPIGFVILMIVLVSVRIVRRSEG